jgi:hypothetical protein
MGQQSPQTEAFATNTAIADLPPLSSQQLPQNNQDPQLEAKASNDQRKDSEEEIKVVIEDELIHLR